MTALHFNIPHADILRKAKALFRIKMKSPYLVGIDIGSAALKIVGTRLGPPHTVLFYSIIDLRKDHSDGLIVSSIQKVIQDNNFTGKDAVVTFTEPTATFRRIELPHMPQDEIISALKWQTRELVTFDIDDAALGFEVLGDIEKEDGSKALKALYVVMPRATINRFVDATKTAGLNVVGVYASAYCLEGIMKLDQEAAAVQTAVILDMGYAKTDICIMKRGALSFLRSVPVGSNDITQALTANLSASSGSAEGAVSLSETDAETCKREIGIPYDETKAACGISATQIVSLIRPVLERLAKEVRRSTDYYIQEYDEEDPSAVYLAGGGSNLKNLESFLSEALMIPAKRMTMPKAFDQAKAAIAEGDAVQMMPALGALCVQKKRMNLLPFEYQTEKLELLEKISLRMVAIIVGVTLLGSLALLKMRVDSLKYQYKNVSFQQGVLSQVRDFKDRVAEREVFQQKARAAEIPVEHLMKELSHIIPPQVVLNWANINESGRVFDMKGVVLEPRGKAEGTLTVFMEALERSSYFKDAQLSSIQGTAMDGEEASAFEISCSLEK